jgi:glutathione S-transferase
MNAIARFEETASMEVTSFDPVANRLIFEVYFKPLFGGETEGKVVKELRGALERVLDGLERELGLDGDGEGRKYMAGDPLTLVDFFYVPYMLKLNVLYREEMFKGGRDWEVGGRELERVVLEDRQCEWLNHCLEKSCANKAPAFTHLVSPTRSSLRKAARKRGRKRTRDKLGLSGQGAKKHSIDLS